MCLWREKGTKHKTRGSKASEHPNGSSVDFVIVFFLALTVLANGTVDLTVRWEKDDFWHGKVAKTACGDLTVKWKWHREEQERVSIDQPLPIEQASQRYIE